MTEVITVAGVLCILLLVGGLVGLIDWRNFKPRWLLIATVMVLLNDALLTNLYGLLPDLLPSLQWNWQGKLLALAATLMLARSPCLGWANAGLAVKQAAGSLRTALPVAVVYCVFFVALAFAFPSGSASHETIAFQLSMPGLEEEAFYRGLLLAALDRAYRGRVRFLGIDWGWGAPLSCVMFGLAHAFGYSDGAFAFEPMVMLLTTIPAILAVWLRYRTGSLLLPVVLHNAGNSASFLV